MKYRTSTELRQLFLDFFVAKGHVIEPSSSLIPHNDPTLLWINSGVAALKKYFDGSETPNARRIVNAQKSLRANDIENVGVTARHHTFFEMLGNFSIGDYFRPEAISYAWEFLTSPEWIGFDAERLYVSVYPTDQASYVYWKDTIGVAEDHIVFSEDNFWEIGEGPCGPCTEIFYDRGPSYNGTTPAEELVVTGENDRYIEIWNIVFSQYNAQKGQTREEYAELPAKNIDTGMGFERMLALIQDGKTNFETDLFLPLIATIETLSGLTYSSASVEEQTAFKLIADHIRAIVFAIADGALPSNEGRGYVIRRLLRRAARYGRKLNIHDVFLAQLVPVVIEIMKGYYSYLVDKKDLIMEIVRAEERKFNQTLAEGDKKLSEMLAHTDKMMLSGADAFMLYDTYGFPIELTIEIAAERGFQVDEATFAEHMNQQKEQARLARTSVASMQQQHEVLQNFQTESTFVGYTVLEATVKPLLLVQGDRVVKQLIAGEQGLIILDQTPFYAESGGQVGDEGTLVNGETVVRVDDVKKAPHGQHVHMVTVVSGFVDETTTLRALVDTPRRQAIERNHTATHLLQFALRTVLGTHIEQAGSFVNSQRLRFDFSHFEALSAQQLTAIERQVNEMIWQGTDVRTELMNIEEAKSLGAMALFSEKYSTEVRVIQAGPSIELCGGTHVRNTAAIGIFKIVQETSVGSGIRRLEALTSTGVYEYLQAQEDILTTLQQTLRKKQKGDLVSGVEQLLEEQKQTRKQLQQLQHTVGEEVLLRALEQPINIHEEAVIVATFPQQGIAQLKQNVDIVKERLSDYIVVLLGTERTQTHVVVAVSPSKVGTIQSNTIVQAFNEILGSRGGGKPEIAQMTVKKQVTKAEIVNILQNIVK